MKFHLNIQNCNIYKTEYYKISHYKMLAIRGQSHIKSSYSLREIVLSGWVDLGRNIEKLYS